jgi:prepilin-type N-terminal cleavage/methylation domain-containing protein
MESCRKKQGFTLIELLVVIAIIAILAAKRPAPSPASPTRSNLVLPLLSIRKTMTKKTPMASTGITQVAMAGLVRSTPTSKVPVFLGALMIPHGRRVIAPMPITATIPFPLAQA